MSAYDFELEVGAYFEVQAMMNGKRNKPTQAFLDEVRKKFATPVTPQQLGWDEPT